MGDDAERRGWRWWAIRALILVVAALVVGAAVLNVGGGLAPWGDDAPGAAHHEE